MGLDRMINRLPKNYVVSDRLLSEESSGVGSSSAGFAKRWSSQAASTAANCIGSRPLASLGVAFVLGLVVGKLVKQ